MVQKTHGIVPYDCHRKIRSVSQGYMVIRLILSDHFFAKKRVFW